MKRFLIIAATCFLLSLNCLAAKYEYDFKGVKIPVALTKLVKDHPESRVNFIYDELEDYATTCRINTDNLLLAVRKIIGVNPVIVHTKGETVYVEAIQKGKFHYTGRAIGENGEGVSFATVMMLNPGDSVIITYGISDKDGFFKIPCDKRNLIAKLSSVGYKVKYVAFDAFAMGNIVMNELPVRLKALTVESDVSLNYPDRTVAIPTTKQKNSSIDAIDLLSRLPFPQIRINPVKETVETFNGKSVSIYFDGLPANKGDLKGMNMRDVKRVEYLEYPKDPRFQGAPYVVNFIMQQYEYGGYAKFLGYENFIINSGLLQSNARLQYKKMRYDIMFLGFYNDSPHIGQEQKETFRLLQPDGSINTFERYSRMDGADRVRNQYYATFRATYDSDNITASSTLTGSIDRMPHDDRHGMVGYKPAEFASSEYDLTASTYSKFVDYSGNYYFKLNHNNSMTFSPKYSYSHTKQNSIYEENGFSGIKNGAIDNTNEIYGRLNYYHSFNAQQSLSSFIRSEHDNYHTRYSGSANSNEKAKVTTFGGGATYAYNNNTFYGSIGIGWDSYWSELNDIKEKRTRPWIDLFIQYIIKNKHTLSLEFHHSNWAPSPSYRSENVIQSNHLMSYTGNPNLVPHRSYDLSLSYRFMTKRNFSLGVSYSTWIVGDRYVYDYESSPTGILRTIKQPLGSYNQHRMGINGYLYLFDRKMTVYASVNNNLCNNGAPYDWTKSNLDFSFTTYYYAGDFNFSIYYQSPMGYSDGCMVGKWAKEKSIYRLSAGWGNSNWTIKADLNNFFRWNWKGRKFIETSRYYDNLLQEIDLFYHAFVNVSATYTFGYGKKVDRKNELRQQGSASSGILK